MIDESISIFTDLEYSNWPSESDHVVVKVQGLPLTNRILVGKGIEGLPFLVVPTLSDSSIEPDQRFQNLRIHHGLTASIHSSVGESRQIACSIVSCLTQAHIHAFLSFGNMLGSAIDGLPSPKLLANLVVRFADMLTFMQKPTSETVRGFWSELLLMTESSTPEIMISAWHASRCDLHDFVLDDERIEVKSSSVRVRRHQFSHNQLQPVGGKSPFIVSIQLQSGNGPTVGELVQQILEDPRVTSDNKQKLITLALDTLGTDWLTEADQRFDLTVARESLKFYEAAQLPQIEEPLPEGVTSLSYSIEIADHVVAIDLQNVLADSPLLGSVLKF